MTDRSPVRRRLLLVSLVVVLLLAGGGVAAAALWPTPVSATASGVPDGPLGADDLAGLEVRITPTDGVRAEA